MASPTDVWLAFLAAAGKKGQRHQDSIAYKHLEREILPALKKEGFAVPVRRSLEGALASGLVPLEEEMIGLRQKKTKLCSFHHLLNLLWLPILDYIEALDRQDVKPDWTRSLDFHQAAIASEMRGLVPGHEEAMDMDQWYVFVQETLQRLLSVHVPTRLIKQVLSPMVPLSL